MSNPLTRKVDPRCPRFHFVLRPGKIQSENVSLASKNKRLTHCNDWPDWLFWALLCATSVCSIVIIWCVRITQSWRCVLGTLICVSHTHLHSQNSHCPCLRKFVSPKRVCVCVCECVCVCVCACRGASSSEHSVWPRICNQSPGTC